MLLLLLIEYAISKAISYRDGGAYTLDLGSLNHGRRFVKDDRIGPNCFLELRRSYTDGQRLWRTRALNSRVEPRRRRDNDAGIQWVKDEISPSNQDFSRGRDDGCGRHEYRYQFKQ